MSNHPNRSRRTDAPGRAPQPDLIRAARLAAGLTQRQAAEPIYATERAWQAWEQGQRPMHPGLWELWKIKASYAPRSRPDIAHQHEHTAERDEH